MKPLAGDLYPNSDAVVDCAVEVAFVEPAGLEDTDPGPPAASASPSAFGGRQRCCVLQQEKKEETSSNGPLRGKQSEVQHKVDLLVTSTFLIFIHIFKITNHFIRTCRSGAV